MSVVGSQQRTLLALLGQLRPHWRVDRNLPARIQTQLARNRSFGSRDRRLYRELIYSAVRYLPWLESILEVDAEHASKLIAWLSGETPITQRFRNELIPDWPPAPAEVSAKAGLLNRNSGFGLAQPAGPGRFDPAQLLPSWLPDECPDAFDSTQIDTIHRRAPLWLRLQSLAVDEVLAEFAQLGWRWGAAAVLPTAVRLDEEVDITKTNSFQKGWIEVQDLASQLLLESAALDPGGSWLDACAGAGGKTLQLAALLGNGAEIDAFDVRPAALEELTVRARRAHLSNIRVLKSTPEGSYDGVLVDAPCTGSGTWRRTPHLKWTTTAQAVAEAAALQIKLLESASERVRLGGRLLYATCSINRTENENVVEQFLKSHAHFASEPPRRSFGGIVRAGGLTLLPALHDSDGFFVAAFHRVV